MKKFTKMEELRDGNKIRLYNIVVYCVIIALAKKNRNNVKNTIEIHFGTQWTSKSETLLIHSFHCKHVMVPYIFYIYGNISSPNAISYNLRKS